jgi:hypothetical protein
MKNKLITTVLTTIICIIVWNIMHRYIGFKPTVIMALAIIYGNQK